MLVKFTLLYMLDLLEENSSAELERLAEENYEGSVLILTCSLPSLAFAAGKWFAAAHLGRFNARLDMGFFSPTSSRWKVADLEPVLNRASLMPISRHVLVLENADQMDQVCFDRLLKITEQPPAPTLFVLTGTSPSTFKPTIQGRASFSSELVPLDEPSRAQMLVKRGFDARSALKAVRLSGPLPHLCVFFLRSSAFYQYALTALDPRIPRSSPASSAASRLQALLRMSSFMAVNEELLASSSSEEFDPNQNTISEQTTDLFGTFNASSNNEVSVQLPDLEFSEDFVVKTSDSQKAHLRSLLLLFAHHRSKYASTLLSSISPQGVASQLDAVALFRRRLTDSTMPLLALTELEIASFNAQHNL